MYVKELDRERWHPLSRFQGIEGTPENLIGWDGDEQVKLDHYAWHPDLVGAPTVPAAPGTWLLDAELKRYAVVAWAVPGVPAHPVLAPATLGNVDPLRHRRAILFPDGHVEVVGKAHVDDAQVFSTYTDFVAALPALQAEWAEEDATYRREVWARRTTDNVVSLREPRS